MQQVNIRLVDVVGGPICVDHRDGARVFEILKDHLNKQDTVTVSFDDIDIVTTSFLNYAFGQLYGLFLSDYLKSHLKVTDASPDALERLSRAIRNGKNFYNTGN